MPGPIKRSQSAPSADQDRRFDALLSAMLGLPASQSQPSGTAASDAERDEGCDDIQIGVFDEDKLDEAVAAYAKAAIKHHGEFARVDRRGLRAAYSE